MPIIKLERDILIEMIQRTRSKVDLTVPENRDVIDELEKIVAWLACAPIEKSQSQFPKTYVGR